MFSVFGMMEGNLVSNSSYLHGAYRVNCHYVKSDGRRISMAFWCFCLRLPFWNCEIKAWYSIALQKYSSSQATLKEVNLAETFYKNEISTLLKLYLACIECPWNAEIIWQGFILWLLMIKLEFLQINILCLSLFLNKKIIVT